MRATIARWLRRLARRLSPAIPPTTGAVDPATADDLASAPPRFAVTVDRGGATVTLYAGDSGRTARDVYLTHEALARHYGDRHVMLSDGGLVRSQWPRGRR